MAKFSEFASEMISREGALLVLGIAFMAAAYVIPQPITVYLGYICLFTAFDVFGFTRTDHSKGTAAYRIIQFMFQAALTAYVFEWQGFWTALACTIAWWFLACDVLFYWALGVKVTAFTWFRESPVIAFYTILLGRSEAPALAVKLSAFVGFATGLLLTIFIERG